MRRRCVFDACNMYELSTWSFMLTHVLLELVTQACIGGGQSGQSPDNIIVCPITRRLYRRRGRTNSAFPRKPCLVYMPPRNYIYSFQSCLCYFSNITKYQYSYDADKWFKYHRKFLFGCANNVIFDCFDIFRNFTCVWNGSTSQF